ncbi:MAG: Rid family hydrolase [Allosphingosinicella sp.]|uniref:Rid family hydrolase n=1 Tax=Allosphingosinicella sp. TaxID=2823234 RepID=UPI00393C2857
MTGDRRLSGGGAEPAGAVRKERTDRKAPAALAGKSSAGGRKIGLYLLIVFGLHPGLAFAAEPARTDATVLMSEHPQGRAFQERYGYSDAVIAGDLVFVSGVVVGLAPGESDLGPAYERAYRQIGAILARAGSSWDDVVDMTSYHTDVAAQLEPMSVVHKSFVSAPYPAWTAIDVDRLVPEGGITEIKVVARRSAARPAD